MHTVLVDDSLNHAIISIMAFSSDTFALLWKAI